MPTNHDLFLVTKSASANEAPDRLTHIKVDADGVPVEIRREVGLAYGGRRKVMNIAQPEGAGTFCGPGFSILPNRPDPDASQMSCFLINPQNLRDVNPWNAMEWSQSPDYKDESLELDHAPEFLAADFDALLAGPAGKVYLVHVDGGARPTIREVPHDMLALQGELWTQLRNGLVAGSVRFADGENGRFVPTFNVTAVMRPTEAAPAPAPAVAPSAS